MITTLREYKVPLSSSLSAVESFYVPPLSRLEGTCGLSKSGHHVTMVYQPDRDLVHPVEMEKEIRYQRMLKKKLFK